MSMKGCLSLVNVSRFINFLWKLVFILFPYTSFPMPFFRATVSPLAIIPLCLLSVLQILLMMQNGLIRARLLWHFLFVVCFTVITSTIMVLGLEQQVWKGSTGVKELLISATTLLMAVIALFAGCTIGRRLENINNFVTLVFIGYLPPMLFGLLHVTSSYLLGGSLMALLKTIHGLVSQGGLGYGRISLLTLEPSWAANQLVSFYIPVFLAIYIYRDELPTGTRKISLVGLVTGVFLTVFTLSAGGTLTLALIFAYVLLTQRSLLPKGRFAVAASILLLPIIVLIILSSPLVETGEAIFVRLRHVIGSRLVSGRGYYDGSAVVRSTYWKTGVNIFLEYPLFGVGWGNAGFYFPKFIGYGRMFDEVANYLSASNNLIPNIKNIYVRILAESGILGFLLFLSFFVCVWLKTKSKTCDSLEVRIVKLFVRLSIIAWISEGMSFDTFGFVYPWVQIGFLDSLLNRSVVPQGVSRRSKPHWCGSRRMDASHE